MYIHLFKSSSYVLSYIVYCNTSNLAVAKKILRKNLMENRADKSIILSKAKKSVAEIMGTMHRTETIAIGDAEQFAVKLQTKFI